jgi:hypothetical protein
MPQPAKTRRGSLPPLCLLSCGSAQVQRWWRHELRGGTLLAPYLFLMLASKVYGWQSGHGTWVYTHHERRGSATPKVAEIHAGNDSAQASVGCYRLNDRRRKGMIEAVHRGPPGGDMLREEAHQATDQRAPHVGTTANAGVQRVNGPSGRVVLRVGRSQGEFSFFFLLFLFLLFFFFYA